MSRYILIKIYIPEKHSGAVNSSGVKGKNQTCNLVRKTLTKIPQLLAVTIDREADWIARY
jgi:hypothetical protein